jgi:hypothetical protein
MENPFWRRRKISERRFPRISIWCLRRRRSRNQREEGQSAGQAAQILLEGFAGVILCGEVLSFASHAVR